MSLRFPVVSGEMVEAAADTGFRHLWTMVRALILEKKLWELVAHRLTDLSRLLNTSLGCRSCNTARRKVR